MIVRPAGDRLLLITQPDHAHLAARVMAEARPLASRARRDAILHAIAEHDNGWAEPDAAPLVDPATGGIADFVSAPAGVLHAVWPRGVAQIASDPWAAALVAQHAIAVYDRYRSDPEWMPFFARMEASRDALLQAGGGPLADLLSDYVFVRLGDLVSLVFCTGWTDEHRIADWTVRLVGTTVTVTPDPFGGVAVPMEIEARDLPGRRFASDADLRAAIRDAPATSLRGEAAGPHATR